MVQLPHVARMVGLIDNCKMNAFICKTLSGSKLLKAVKTIINGTFEGGIKQIKDLGWMRQYAHGRAYNLSLLLISVEYVKRFPQGYKRPRRI